MGIKKMFKKKEPTEEELRQDLNTIGIATKSSRGREEKFGAFRQYAQEKLNAKPGLAPVNPYANISGVGGDAGNPYSQNGNNGQEEENGEQSPYGASNGQANVLSPYDKQTTPYGQQLANPYGGGGSGQARGGQSNPYGAARTSGQSNGRTSMSSTAAGARSDPYSNQTHRSNIESSRRAPAFDEESLDLNAIPSNQMYVSKKPIKRPQMRDDETLDLNDLPEEEDLNLDVDELQEEQQVDSEDEEVEAIKQDIRFVKQESLGSTRNTLRMAQEADASATNTLGMMGSQSERLYNAEQNLLLADTQTQIADEKVKELKRLNRSIFVPATGNPFNKKSRLRQQEMKIKTNKTQEKYLRDTNRKEMYASEQRIKLGISQNATNSDVHQKYQGEKDLEAAKRYQFENDSEDDEMEKELAGNLDQIGLYSKKLKNSAQTMGKEVDSQNTRLGKIEEDADRLDINVHLNNTRLSNIR